MAVIINELEIVVDTRAPAAPASEGQASAQGGRPPAAAPRPLDLSDMLERRVRMRRRIFAH